MKTRKTVGGSFTGEAVARPATRDIATLASCFLHDFGNLLTLMSGHAELLARSPVLDEAAKDDVLCIRSATRRAIHFVSSWADFVRPVSPRSESIPLAKILAEVEALAVPSLDASVSLRCSLEQAVSVVSHYEHLQRTLLNLILNARDAVGRNGTIELRVEVCPFRGEAEGGVRITVEDNGIGIDPDTLDRIAEPFYTTKKHGSGLGLAQVSDFVRSWSGTLEIESEPGAGSSFSITLPRGCEAAPAGVHSEPPPKHQEGIVLLVQPDRDLVDAIRPVLERAGYSVLVASGAGDALLILDRSRDPIDAVVVDAELPWMSARELNGLVRDKYRSVAIVVLTCSPKARDLDADQVLVKPFDIKVLPQELARLIHPPHAVSETRIKTLSSREQATMRRKRG